MYYTIIIQNHCLCICLYIILPLQYRYMYVCMYLWLDISYELVHPRARPCPMAARASRMGEAQKSMLNTGGYYWFLLGFTNDHHQTGQTKDGMDRIASLSSNISNKRSKRCSIRLLWLGMTVATATGLDGLWRNTSCPTAESIDFLTDTADIQLGEAWTLKESLSSGSVVMRKRLKGVALLRILHLQIYLGTESGKV